MRDEKINITSAIYTVPFLLLVLYLFTPFRIGGNTALSSQHETVLISFLLSVFCLLLYSFFLFFYQKNISIKIKFIDIVFVIHALYISLLKFKYPIDNLDLFWFLSIILFYFYLKNIHVKHILLLLPVCSIIQIIYGITQFSQPWPGLTHKKPKKSLLSTKFQFHC